MTERALIRSQAQVRALLAGATQVRVPVVPQPNAGPDGRLVNLGNMWGLLDGILSGEWRCPLGVAGDRLVVKETWLPFDRDHWIGDRRFAYRADTTPEGEAIRRQYGYRWCSPATMPRSAARLILEVVEVRAEKMDDAEVDDFSAEGMSCACGLPRPSCGRRQATGASVTTPATIAAVELACRGARGRVGCGGQR